MKTQELDKIKEIRRYYNVQPMASKDVRDVIRLPFAYNIYYRTNFDENSFFYIVSEFNYEFIKEKLNIKDEYINKNDDDFIKCFESPEVVLESYNIIEYQKLENWINYIFDKSNHLSDEIFIEGKNGDELIIIIEGDLRIIGSISSDNPLSASVFENENYNLTVYNFINNTSWTCTATFINNDEKYIINSNIDNVEENYYEMITQICNNQFHGFDELYYNKLIIIRDCFGYDNLNSIRIGGRFEYLFYRLLNKLHTENNIDMVQWNGSISEQYNLYTPAPGGRHGTADIIFEIENFRIILEVTTIRANALQWSNEATSSADHFSHQSNLNPDRQVIGIFSAPTIGRRTMEHLALHANENDYSCFTIEAQQLAEILSSSTRTEILDFLESRINDD